jgi:hypothetical protein
LGKDTFTLIRVKKINPLTERRLESIGRVLADAIPAVKIERPDAVGREWGLG